MSVSEKGKEACRVCVCVCVYCMMRANAKPNKQHNTVTVTVLCVRCVRCVRCVQTYKQTYKQTHTHTHTHTHQASSALWPTNGTAMKCTRIHSNTCLVPWPRSTRRRLRSTLRTTSRRPLRGSRPGSSRPCRARSCVAGLFPTEPCVCVCVCVLSPLPLSLSLSDTTTTPLHTLYSSICVDACHRFAAPACARWQRPCIPTARRTTTISAGTAGCCCCTLPTTTTAPQPWQAAAPAIIKPLSWMK